MTSPLAAPGQSRSNGAGDVSADRRAVISTLAQLVEPLAAAMPPSCEVLLHDLSLLPNSIVAIAGDVTGRRVGDPATDLLLEHVIAGDDEHLVGYETVLADGRRMCSTTIMIRDRHGVPTAALCINADQTPWQALEHVRGAMMGAPKQPMPSAPAAAATTSPEQFFNDVDELAAHLLRTSIEEVGVPVELMKKEHKVAVVARLQDRGMFLLRRAVETVASALGVSRFAVYNYLNELNGGDALVDPAPTDPVPTGTVPTDME